MYAAAEGSAYRLGCGVPCDHRQACIARTTSRKSVAQPKLRHSWRIIASAQVLRRSVVGLGTPLVGALRCLTVLGILVRIELHSLARLGCLGAVVMSAAVAASAAARKRERKQEC
jgi:hypothetical protein